MTTVDEDVLEIYECAEQKLLNCGIWEYDSEAVRNCFQVFRYAFRQWAEGKRKERVLAAVLYPVQEKVKIDYEIVVHHIVFGDDERMKQNLRNVLNGNDEG